MLKNMKKCEICGGKFFGRFKGKGKLFCHKHYRQMVKYGDIRKRNFRERNDFRIIGDLCYMDLYDRYGLKRAETVFDKQFLGKVILHRWGFSRGYCRCGKIGKTLHNLIFGFATKKQELDHINRNRLDNRGINIRFVKRWQNCANSGRKHLNKHGIVGIYQDKRDKCWYPRIKRNGKTFSLGRFKVKEDAIKAREKAEIAVFGIYRAVC